MRSSMFKYNDLSAIEKKVISLIDDNIKEQWLESLTELYFKGLVSFIPGDK